MSHNPRYRRILVGLASVTLALSPSLINAPAAWGIPEPVYDANRDVPPPDDTPGPPAGVTMEIAAKCVVSGVLEGAKFDNIPVQDVLDVPLLHSYATGKGQTVAVIDSGVNRNARLPELIGGGDYILGGDGLQDCDAHGTLIAGIIAARPALNDAFIGVAPDASIISIRQSSRAFKPDYSKSPRGYNDEVAQTAASLHTLARAIVHAANMGATVINMSVTACYKADTPMDTAALAGALYYAAVERNVVLVTSAGNLDAPPKCKQNPGPSPSSPGDPRGWGTVKYISLPSMFSQFVLSVGRTDLVGGASTRSMGGPWVGVGAPGENIISLNPDDPVNGTLINSQMQKENPNSSVMTLQPINGTSFSAAYVSGLAALIREKYPNLTARQVIQRITDTAHTPADGLPSNLLGYGVIDPVAALTADIIPGEKVAAGVPPKGAAAVPTAAPPNHTARNIAIVTVPLAFLGLAVFLGLLATARVKQKRIEEGY